MKILYQNSTQDAKQVENHHCIDNPTPSPRLEQIEKKMRKIEKKENAHVKHTIAPRGLN